MTSFMIFRFFALVTVLVYLIFDAVDRKRVRDEREDLIRLKASELTAKLTTACLTIIAVLFLWWPDMSAFYPVTAVILANMYGEIFGKLFYRRRL